MSDLRRTKIVATIGPACDPPGVLEAVVAAGVDVARLNASHATIDELAARLARVRQAADSADRPVAVLLDLPGPKVRVGDVAAGTTLQAGARFSLLGDVCVGDATHACVTYDNLGDDLSAGDLILLDDGALELEVQSSRHGEVVTLVVRGGPLSSRKGVNVPGVRLAIESVSPRDLELLAWGISAGVELVAQSFVREAADVALLRGAMGEHRVPLVAKVEKHEALSDLDRIIAAADAVMVARGDLAVETSPEAVPPAQRRIVSACRSLGRPVIVATQMLESMVGSPRPTRAEASDVATAVFEGADAVMLSEETAVGLYPVEAVRTMDRVCRAAEDAGPPTVESRPGGTPTAAVAAAAVDLAAAIGAAAIVTATQTGSSARAVAACRPAVPVLAMTPVPAVGRALAVVWGVSPHLVTAARSIEEMTDLAIRTARASGRVRAGDRVILTAGTSVGVSGSTDLLRVLTL
ncbi:MAG: pyruvate kinase [Coriobacteriia bacterium]|nr:pyruvate kinase [Coriobacteriia bacterium]